MVEPIRPHDQSPDRAPDKSVERFPGLDGLRGVAATAVVLFHVSGFTDWRSDQDFVGKMFLSFDMSLPIFFVISGFLIYRPFVIAHLDGRGAPHTKRFYLKRATRILPAYWVALTVIWLVFGNVHFNGLKDVVVFYGLLQIYFEPFYFFGGISQGWTLCVEAAFYLLLPVYAVAIGSLARRARSAVTVEVAGAVILMIIGFTTRAVLVIVHPDGTTSTSWLSAQLDQFGFGMLLAVLSAHGARQKVLPRLLQLARDHALAMWAIAIGAYTIAAQGFFTGGPLTGRTPREEIIYRALIDVFAGFIVVPFAFPSTRPSIVRRFMTVRVIAGFGIVSYGVYLWHVDILIQLEQHGVIAWFSRGQFYVVAVITIVISAIVATVSWRYLEKPLIQWANRRGRAGRSSPAAPANAPGRSGA